MKINLVGCEKDGVLITHDERWYCEQCRLPDDIYARLLAAERLAEAAEHAEQVLTGRLSVMHMEPGEGGALLNLRSALSAWKEASK